MNSMKSKVLTMANKLVGKGYTRSKAMLKAWVLAKAQTVSTKVDGVTFEDRQELLKLLSKCSPVDMSVKLVHEAGNAYDKNAVAVWAAVSGKLTCKIGYLPKAVAYVVAPLLDKGNAPTSRKLDIVGGNEFTLGARLQIQL
ncbi:MAG: HIRAN domain-containing protein [Oscillospiraceae bacterium]